MRNPAILVLIVSLTIHNTVLAEVRERIGYANDIESGRLVYTENHEERYEDGNIRSRIVRYLDPEGELLAFKTVEYGDNGLMPDFELRIESTGYLEGARNEHDRVQVYYRLEGEQALNLKHVAKPVNAIADAGFDRFIQQYWSQLSEGEVLQVPFLVPSLTRFIDFTVRQIAAETSTGHLARMFRMMPKSRILRWFSEPIDVVYDDKTRALLEYRGISNLRDHKGKNFNVVISFPEKISRRFQWQRI